MNVAMMFYWPRKKPLRVLIVNPLIDSAQIAIIRMLTGSSFGSKQTLDITLLVYSNEIVEAEGFIQDLKGCNFGCLNTIVATSDLPSIDDADIFCFLGGFKNPNFLDDDLNTDDNFDTTYLTLKVALSLGKAVSVGENKNDESEEQKEYPIIVADGLLILDMVHSMGNIGIPSSRYFCHCNAGIKAQTLLSDLLQVQCNDINKSYVWGVNDRMFHVEIEKPYVVYDTISDKSYCDWEMVSVELLEPLKLDHTQFNASWMKKEFIAKIKSIIMQNPYSGVFKGWKLARCLSVIWDSTVNERESYVSMGVISDGSLRTIKGLPYYLPVIFNKNSTEWKVNTRFQELPHVIQEIEKFNKVAKHNHDRLVKYCTKFIAENIIKQSFISPDSEEIDSNYSSSHNIPISI
ncbi:unnamed protein product [Arctia plantaginis]|uniref:Uncharacterized protein n=1 Tax=Arctia plantaginis TaxID=874455 RepID=A0A8S0ZQN0_ARCPL|nr:unnamed protein product [Arctia plantaginis]